MARTRTVRELKDQLKQETDYDYALGDKAGKYRQKLNALGWERRTGEPEECEDIDATAPLSEEEYQELLAEAYQVFSRKAA